MPQPNSRSSTILKMVLAVPSDTSDTENGEIIRQECHTPAQTGTSERNGEKTRQECLLPAQTGTSERNGEKTRQKDLTPAQTEISEGNGEKTRQKDLTPAQTEISEGNGEKTQQECLTPGLTGASELSHENNPKDMRMNHNSSHDSTDNEDFSSDTDSYWILPDDLGLSLSSDQEIDFEGVNEHLDMSLSQMSSSIIRNEDDISENNSIVQEQAVVQLKSRPKKGRKRKHPSQTKADAKKLKDMNKPYINYKGVEQRPKSFLDFVCSCKKQCNGQIDVNRRLHLFEEFYNLGSYNNQTTFIATMVRENPVQRHYKGNPDKIAFNRNYQIAGVNVCRDFFCKTFGISTKRVNTALTKVRNGSLTDQRGKVQGGANKVSQDREMEVIEHIKAIPKYKSHYRRETNNGSEYLPLGCTLPKMYKNYVSKVGVERAVSETKYKDIFYKKFNLKMKTLKKDTCNRCDYFHAVLRNETSVIQRTVLEMEHTEHLTLAGRARELMNSDLLRAQTDEKLETLTFDLEKTLPLPRLQTGIVFYKRQLWLYNSGVHAGKTDTAFFYVWLENEAGRGAQEVGSCLIKHLKTHLSPNVQELILWADSCGGQNRNIKIVLMLKCFLNSSDNLSLIKLRFLVSGHTFLPNDTDFSFVERALKYKEKIYDYKEYLEVMRAAKKKRENIVTKMTSNAFRSVEMVEKKIVNRKVTAAKEKVSWLKTREITLKKEEPNLIYMKYDFSSESTTYVINIEKKPRRQNQVFQLNVDSLTPLWPNGRKINKAKLDDLNSMMHLIPACDQSFYKSLQSDTTEEVEDVDRLNEILDFVIEED